MDRGRASWVVSVFFCVGVCAYPVRTECVKRVATRVVANIERPIFKYTVYRGACVCALLTTP